MALCSDGLGWQNINDSIILKWKKERKSEQLKKFILQPLQFSKKSKIKKYFLFLLYAESENKTKFLLLLQVFFLCFYRLAPGKASIYGGYVYIYGKTSRAGNQGMCSLSLSPYSFFHNPYKPSIIGTYRKSTLNSTNPQLLVV